MSAPPEPSRLTRRFMVPASHGWVEPDKAEGGACVGRIRDEHPRIVPALIDVNGDRSLAVQPARNFEVGELAAAPFRVE